METIGSQSRGTVVERASVAVVVVAIAATVFADVAAIEPTREGIRERVTKEREALFGEGICRVLEISRIEQNEAESSTENHWRRGRKLPPVDGERG